MCGLLSICGYSVKHTPRQVHLHTHASHTWCTMLILHMILYQCPVIVYTFFSFSSHKSGIPFTILSYIANYVSNWKYYATFSVRLVVSSWIGWGFRGLAMRTFININNIRRKHIIIVNMQILHCMLPNKRYATYLLSVLFNVFDQFRLRWHQLNKTMYNVALYRVITRHSSTVAVILLYYDPGIF